MRNKRIIPLIALVFFCLVGISAQAQMSSETFGRNRIQYRQFEWEYLSSDNFDIYFYEGGDKIAKEVNDYLEEEFEKITDLIGYPPYSKTKLFLYNSVADLQQSNVGVNDVFFSPGGETNFIKSTIEVANPGNIEQLKEELLYKVSRLLVNEMMFGGSLTDMFQSSVLLNLPEWFIEGAALYVSKGWTIEMDDYVRELMDKKRPTKLNRLTGKEAALAGQSVWNFIAEKYGRSNISNILNYTRIIRNEEKSITITLGMSYDRVMVAWKEFYTQIDKQVAENYVTIKEDNRIVDKHNGKGLIYTNIKLSKDGTKLAYSVNNRGRFQVRIKDLSSGKEKTVLKGGYKVIAQEIDANLPLVEWIDENTLGIVQSKKGQIEFVQYDYPTNSALARPLNKFENVKSIDFSDNGRLFVASAVVDGKNDLYLMSTKRDRTKRLMSDIYDDTHPSFVPGTDNQIVFSSNRITDTLSVKEKKLNGVSDNYNLFLFHLDTTKNVVHRLTNTISKDTNPLAVSGSKIYYLSDQKGITNIFSYDLNTGIYTQVTNYDKSVVNYDISTEGQQLVFTMKEDGNDYIYYQNNFDFTQQIFTPSTIRQQLLQAKAFKEKQQKKKGKPKTIEQLVEERLAQAESNEEIEEPDTEVVDTVISELDTAQIISDTTAVEKPIEEKEQIPTIEVIDTDNYTFEEDTSATEGEDTEPTKAEDIDVEIIDTDDYVFDNDVVKDDKKDLFLNYRQLRKDNQIDGPYPYEPRFSTNNLLTSFIIDPLRGFGVKIETQMADLLENHKIHGGIMSTTDLRNGDVFAEYQYLKNRIDYNVRYDRNVYFFDEILHRFTKNRFQVGAALPFNTKTRLAVNPFYSRVHSEDVDNLSGAYAVPELDPRTDEYVGADIELVFDNSVINGMNLIEGTRAKVKLEHHQGLSDQNLSFSNISVDFRHYQKLYKEIVLAGRVYYGNNFGNSPKQYLLGGMDNWLFYDENTEGDGNPLLFNKERYNTDLVFTKYATNLRGFDYATLVGESTLVFNGELRVPIIKALSNGPVSSNFFSNLQFTGFFDIGSAWTGTSPFHEENNVSTKTIEEGNFTISLKNYRNPWLYSYGAGLRTIILGYYMKFDVAWPVEDYEVGSPHLYVTLGYDF